MTHAELMVRLQRSLIGMHHAYAAACETAFKLRRGVPLRVTTPAGSAEYVVALDRSLRSQPRLPESRG